MQSLVHIESLMNELEYNRCQEKERSRKTILSALNTSLKAHVAKITRRYYYGTLMSHLIADPEEHMPADLRQMSHFLKGDKSW